MFELKNCWAQWLIMQKTQDITMFLFLTVITFYIAVIHLSPPKVLVTQITVHWRNINPYLPHNRPLEFISHSTSDSSTQSNKKLNPATHSLEVKPSLSSDSSGRVGGRRCAKSNQASSQAASDSYWHLFLEISSTIPFETKSFTSFGTRTPHVDSFFRENWLYGNFKASFVSTSARENVNCFLFKVRNYTRSPSLVYSRQKNDLKQPFLLTYDRFPRNE